MGEPLWGQDVWREVWLHLQKPEVVVLTVFHWYIHLAAVFVPSIAWGT